MEAQRFFFSKLGVIPFPLLITEIQSIRKPRDLLPYRIFCVAALLIIALICPCREAEMRTVSEATNARVVWFSTLALWVCIAVSVLQVWHLQGFFRKKKLI